MDEAQMLKRIQPYNEALQDILVDLTAALVKIQNLPPLFSSALYSSGTWETQVDLSVAIQQLTWMVEALDNANIAYVTDRVITITAEGSNNMRHNEN